MSTYQGSDEELLRALLVREPGLKASSAQDSRALGVALASIAAIESSQGFVALLLEPTIASLEAVAASFFTLEAGNMAVDLESITAELSEMQKADGKPLKEMLAKKYGNVFRGRKALEMEALSRRLQRHTDTAREAVLRFARARPAAWESVPPDPLLQPLAKGRR